MLTIKLETIYYYFPLLHIKIVNIIRKKKDLVYRISDIRNIPKVTKSLSVSESENTDIRNFGYLDTDFGYFGSQFRIRILMNTPYTKYCLGTTGTIFVIQCIFSYTNRKFNYVKIEKTKKKPKKRQRTRGVEGRRRHAQLSSSSRSITLPMLFCVVSSYWYFFPSLLITH